MLFSSPRQVITSRVRLERGFSLIEIVVVLALIALLVGGALSVMAMSSDKRQLTEATGKVSSMAKRARAVAILQQRPYALVFHENGVRMMPLAEATGVDSGSSSRSTGEKDNAAASLPSQYDNFEFDDQFRLGVRRWGTNGWLPIKERVTQVWRFDSNGLCEPIGVRMELKDSWVEDFYHPLSAGVDESNSYFP